MVMKLKSNIRRNGGKCKARFLDGVLWIAVRGLDKEWVGRLVMNWRNAVKSRYETTLIEQLDDAKLPPRKGRSIEYPDDLE